MDDDEKTKQWAVKKFGIKPEEFSWYHSGICYDRIGVTTEEAARKVREHVSGQSVNGGMFDGMSLGGATFYDKEKTGLDESYYDVKC